MNKFLRFSKKKIKSFAPNIFQPTWVLIGKLFFKFDWNPNKRCWLLLKSVFSYNCEKNGARQKKMCHSLPPIQNFSHPFDMQLFRTVGIWNYCIRLLHAADTYSAGPQEGLKIQVGGGDSSNVVGIICPKVEIGVTVLPKSGGAMAPPAPPAPPAPTALRLVLVGRGVFDKKKRI